MGVECDAHKTRLSHGFLKQRRAFTCVFVEEEADEELAGEVLRVCELALAAALDPVDELRDGLWPLGLQEHQMFDAVGTHI
eukprot:6173775-Pleurochrysis_carterae.AAC.3